MHQRVYDRLLICARLLLVFYLVMRPIEAYAYVGPGVGMGCAGSYCRNFYGHNFGFYRAILVSDKRLLRKGKVKASSENESAAASQNEAAN